MQRLRSGFTIVELLIVIVVIGILAAITIVAYNGVQQKARIATAKIDVNNIGKQMELFKQSGDGKYPEPGPELEKVLRDIGLFDATRLTLAEEQAGKQPTKSFGFCLASDLGSYLVVAFSPVYKFNNTAGGSFVGSDIYYASSTLSGVRTLQWNTSINTLSNLCRSVDPMFDTVGNRIQRWSYAIPNPAT